MTPLHEESAFDRDWLAVDPPPVLKCVRCGCEWHSVMAHRVIGDIGGCLVCEGPVQALAGPAGD